MVNKNIPSEDDFKRASEYMKHIYRGLSQVEDNIILHFGSSESIMHRFGNDHFIKNEKNNSYGYVDNCIVFLSESEYEPIFGVIIFYTFNKYIDFCHNNGVSLKIRNAVFHELESFGRGKKENIKVNFEFDSYENVRKKYGSYFNRLR